MMSKLSVGLLCSKVCLFAVKCFFADFFNFVFFKQKTAYEIGTGDWSSDVCSSDLWKNIIQVCGLGLSNVVSEQLVGHART